LVVPQDHAHPLRLQITYLLPRMWFFGDSLMR